jgi:hypothetical protein
MGREERALLEPLLRPEAAGALRDEGEGVLSVLGGDASAGRFEGVYGPLYEIGRAHV